MTKQASQTSTISPPARPSGDDGATFIILVLVFSLLVVPILSGVLANIRWYTQGH